MTRCIGVVAITLGALLIVSGANAQDSDEAARLKRENDLLKREYDVLKREHEQLKEEMAKLKAAGPGAKPGAKPPAAKTPTLSDLLPAGASISGKAEAAVKGGNPSTVMLTIATRDGNKFTGLWSYEGTTARDSHEVKGHISGNKFELVTPNAPTPVKLSGTLRNDGKHIEYVQMNAVTGKLTRKGVLTVKTE